MGGMSRTFGLQRQEYGNAASSTRITGQLVRRVLQHFRPYRLQWLVIFLCIIVGALIGAVSPLIVRGIIDHAIPDKNVHLLYLLAGAIVAVAVVAGFVGVLQTWVSMIVGQRIMLDVRNKLYQHLQRQSLGFYTVTRAGEIISRLNNDVAAIQDTSTNTVVTIVTNIVTLIVTLFFIFSMDPKLALLAIVIVPAFILPTRYVGKIRWKLSRETLEHQANLVAFMEERLNIGGIVLTKLFGQAATEAATFADRNREVMDLTVQQSMAGRWLFLCLSLFSVLGPAAVYCYGGLHAISGLITVGTIIAFVAYLSNLYRPVAQLADVYVSLQGALAVFERIYEYLDRTPDVEDAPEAVTVADLAGHLRFCEVSFEYPRPAKATKHGEEPPVEIDRRALKEVSFEVLPGQRVALVGPSGAGKTTITYMLPRFYDPTSGTITVDDLDLKSITQESLREHIGAVTQDTFLFHASIRENLLYARPEATEDQIIAAAQAANIHDFITGLADGYETVVGERGFRLSGGEKQRLAIARALLKDPRILILDEATSSLDATSEYLIQQALEKLLQGRTSVIIAHRLSTILTADKIIVMDKGRIVQSGTHSELMEQGGLYSTLYHQQFAKVMEEQRRTDEAEL